MALKGSRNEVERGKSEDNIIFLKQDIKTVRHKNREGFKKNKDTLLFLLPWKTIQIANEANSKVYKLTTMTGRTQNFKYNFTQMVLKPKTYAFL